MGAAALAVGVLAASGAMLEHGRAEDSGRTVATPGPLMLRGFTDAGDGMAIVASETGGSSLKELRVKEGQDVKRGDIVAVLATYPATEIALRLAEAQLEKAKRRLESLKAGIEIARTPDVPPAASTGGAKPAAAPVVKKPSAGAEPKVSVAEQEEIVRLTDKKRDLKTLEMQRSGLPPEEQALNIGIAEDKSQREHVRLKMAKESLANDLAEAASDVRIKEVAVEQARLDHDHSVLRAPLDGTVTQIVTRPGEALAREVCQIVDMSQLRILVDLDERLISRVKVGQPVDVVFRGETHALKGKVARVSSTVSRMKTSATSGTGTTKLDVVKVEVTLDDPSQMPKIVSREATVTFL